MKFSLRSQPIQKLWIEAKLRLQPLVSGYVPDQALRFKRIFWAILVVSLIGLIGSLGLRVTQTDLTRKVWPIDEIAQSTKNRLVSIAAALDTSRDWVADDWQIRNALISASSQKLFPLLREHDSIDKQRLPDTLLYSAGKANRRLADGGLATYTPEGRLIAWYSSRPVTFGFDTVLTGDYLLQSRDRGELLQSTPRSSVLVAIRKIVTKESRIVGYVVSKRVLATNDIAASGATSTFIDDIKDASHREISIAFGGVPSQYHSDKSTLRIDLYADPADRSSYVGNLAVGTTPISDPSSLAKVLDNVWRIGLSILLIILLIWTLNAASAMPRTNRPLLIRLVYSLVCVAILIIIRSLLGALDGLAVVLPQSFRDPADYGSNLFPGLDRNPFELFITSVFATIAAALLWIIWMPHERLVRDDTQRADISEIVRQEFRGLALFSLLAIFSSQALLDALSGFIGSIVSNGSLRYLVINQVLPSPAMLTMVLAMLGIGVAYLFVSVLLLTFSIRAIIYLLPRSFGFTARVILGSALTAILTYISAAILDNYAFTDTQTAYRYAIASATLIISLAIILIDAFAKQPYTETASFLYRIPRSSRSILFILAASAVLLSPLIARKQLTADRAIAQRKVEESSQVDAPELQTVAANILYGARDQFSSIRIPNLSQAAFLLWFKTLNEHPDWNASIEITNDRGENISEFSTSNSRNELPRLRGVQDTLVHRLRQQNSAGRASMNIVPGFSSSGTPAIVGAIRYASAVGSAYTVSTALWSDLPSLIAHKGVSNFLTGSTRSQTMEDPVTNGGFIVAEYQPNSRRLTNAPSLDVPATIPFWYEYRLRRERSFWHESTISGAKYQTLYYAAPTGSKVAGQMTITTVSVADPTFGKTMEFALRLNAIGLLYGSLIALMLLVIRQTTSRRFRYTLRFRDRIFLIVLLIALVPLVVVTNVTRTLLGDRAHADEKDRLARDASVIKDRVARQAESGYVNIFGVDLQNDVDDLSQIIGRDFCIYDPNGFLRAASNPELYQSSMLSSTLSSNAVEEVVLGKKSFYSEPLAIAGDSYQIGYQPVTSVHGNQLLAVVSLTTLDEQARIEAEIARTTSFIYGTFAALGLVLMGIGALFAARVASPILALIEATERVAKGKLRTSIPVNREDEIGELMHAFNTMTHELEKSREIVAQNERELAWKEMARQVAHEIKNPLTPMKLSVQHIEHAHDAKDPNFNSIFRRVIKTLSEQIDVLTRIATEFSRFGEMPRRKWGAVSLRKVAESAVALFDSDRSRIRFIIDVSPELSSVHADEEELRRAFVNIIRNAVQAIEGWGVIVLRATQDRGMLHVRLTDTGGGMSDETLQRVFDPNFSTKTSGMGLGLAIVKKTITDMSGTIRVESKPGNGTTFFIDLPARGYVENEENGA